MADTNDNPREFVIISDDDGHHFVCPADREEETHRMFDAHYAYWNRPRLSGNPPCLPDFLEEIGGAVSLVKFQKYRIE